jgi:multiple sugar transport system permease protein
VTATLAPPVTSPDAPPKPRRPRGRQGRLAVLLLLPAAVVVFGVVLYPIVRTAIVSFFEVNSAAPVTTPFVGLQNYRDMVHDEKFRNSVVNTVYFTGVSVPAGMAIGLGIALLLNQPLRFRSLLRTMYFLPVVTPFVVVAIIWKWLYNGDFGLFNYYLLKTHLIHDPLLWLSDKNLAMPAVILMTIWTSVGFSMVVYLAGLQSIPEELYEAARVDGAGPFARFRHITLPMLRPTTLFLLVIGIIGSFQVFTQIFVMTNGGPVDRTTTMVFYIYQSAFKFYEMGYASTLAFALFAMLLVFTALQLRLYRKEGV